MQKSWMESFGGLVCAVIALLLHVLLFRGWSIAAPEGTLKPAPVLDAFVVTPIAATAPTVTPVVPMPITKPVQAESPPAKPIVRPHRPVRTERAPRPVVAERAVESKPAVMKMPATENEAQVAAPSPSEAKPAVVAAASAQAAAAQPVLVKKPQFLSPPSRPVYPSVARRRGQQGTVWLEILLSESGKQIKLSIVRSSGFQSLDDAAKVAVADWKLAPYRMNGVAVSSRVQVPVEFVIQ